MFLQLKNTLKYVNIKPCANEMCRCFIDIERKNKKDYKKYATSISEERYYKYEKCYDKQTNINKDIFLL